MRTSNEILIEWFRRLLCESAKPEAKPVVIIDMSLIMYVYCRRKKIGI